MSKRWRVAVVIGTRPEAIKLAPVVLQLRRSKRLTPLVVCTAQHGEMARAVLQTFGIRSFYDLGVMRPRQTLWDVSGRLVSALGDFFARHRTDAALVQGDTASALFGALAAFYHQIPVGHIEAGLRTGNYYSPFPEEMNRTLLASLAQWHFAPTEMARQRLRASGVPQHRVFRTGNTVVDALWWMAGRSRVKPPPGKRKLILVTCHRRESLGPPMRGIAAAIVSIARKHPELTVLFPIHPNPAVRRVVLPMLKQASNVILCEPLNYPDFVNYLQQAHLVLSDSGGVQEEAASLGKPVLVLRNETERQEGIRAGSLKLVGTDAKTIERETERLLDDPNVYRKMARRVRVFGDGHAAERIVEILEREVPRELRR